MNFNSFLFPAPEFDFTTLKEYYDELIYIPTSNPKEHIPCLFMSNEISRLHKNFIIFFHGNAEDIFLSKHMAYGLLEKLNMNIIIVEYPGYSIYKGEASPEKILENTKIVYDYIKNIFNLEDKNMYIYGRSIGTSPAIYLASVANPNALFVVSSFTSIRSVAGNIVGPLKYLLKDRFFSTNYIQKVKCPTILIHGKSDPLIPYKETEELAKNCKCKHKVVLRDYMTHNDFNLYGDIMDHIDNFVKDKDNGIVVDNEEYDIIKENKKEFEILSKMPSEIKLYIDEKNQK